MIIREWLIIIVFIISQIGISYNIQKREHIKNNHEVNISISDIKYINYDLITKNIDVKTEQKNQITKEEKEAEERKIAEEKRIEEEKRIVEEQRRKEEEIARQKEIERQRQIEIQRQIAEQKRQEAINSNIRTSLNTKFVNYLTNENNAKSVFERAVSLHYGDVHNTCVYFQSEALRRIGFYVPDSISNTTQLTNYLSNKGWRIEYDYKKLKAGDICFTTADNGGKGNPTHAYTFVKWVEEGKYDYAYIVDNQAPDYGTHNHIRNISIRAIQGENERDAIQYFMYEFKY